MKDMKLDYKLQRIWYFLNMDENKSMVNGVHNKSQLMCFGFLLQLPCPNDWCYHMRHSNDEIFKSVDAECWTELFEFDCRDATSLCCCGSCSTSCLADHRWRVRQTVRLSVAASPLQASISQLRHTSAWSCNYKIMKDRTVAVPRASVGHSPSPGHSVAKVPLDDRERSSCTSIYWDPAFPHLKFQKTLGGPQPPVGGPRDVVPHLWFSSLTHSSRTVPLDNLPHHPYCWP